MQRYAGETFCSLLSSCSGPTCLIWISRSRLAMVSDGVVAEAIFKSPRQTQVAHHHAVAHLHQGGCSRYPPMGGSWTARSDQFKERSDDRGQRAAPRGIKQGDFINQTLVKSTTGQSGPMDAGRSLKYAPYCVRPTLIVSIPSQYTIVCESSVQEPDLEFDRKERQGTLVSNVNPFLTSTMWKIHRGSKINGGEPSKASQLPLQRSKRPASH